MSFTVTEEFITDAKEGIALRGVRDDTILRRAREIRANRRREWWRGFRRRLRV